MNNLLPFLLSIVIGAGILAYGVNAHWGMWAVVAMGVVLVIGLAVGSLGGSNEAEHH